jgi:hypothetical protein
MKLLKTLSLGKGLSRRQLLKVLGVSAATAPMLPTLDSWAQPGDVPPKRMLLLFTSSGTIPELYYPTGTETAWNFPANGILEPLNKHKADLMILKGLKRGAAGGGGHEGSMGGLWTGNSCKSSVAQAPSVDQIIASKIAKKTDFQSFPFGVHTFYHAEGDIKSKITGNNPYMIHTGANQKVASECDPKKVYDKLFAGLGTGGPADTTQMDRVRAERKSVLDILKEDISEVESKVAKEDRLKIGSHLQALREIEQRLDSGGAKMVGAIPMPDGSVDITRNANYPACIGIMNKLVVAALASDRTRIASLQWSRGFSKITHSWVGAKEGHHYISHKTTEKTMLANIQRWYSQRFSELFDLFKGVQEGAGTLFDSTLCVYSNELALGWTHGVDPAATWWATGAKGKFGGTVPRPGRFIDFTGSSFDYNQMLVTMAHAMGATMVDKIGDFGKPGTIPSLLT